MFLQKKYNHKDFLPAKFEGKNVNGTINRFPINSQAYQRVRNVPDFSFNKMDVHNKPHQIQIKLTINTAGDKYEKEADTTANKIMHPANEPGRQNRELSRGITPRIQTKVETAAAPVSSSLSNRIASTIGGGSGMDNKTQSFMSNRFGADFEHVKIHTDNEAQAMNKELGAKAFTVGSDIYFNSGEYQPGSSKGKQLLAHELTHTIQQHGQLNKIQRDVDTSLPPMSGSLTLRLNTNGRVEVLAGTPELPVTGSLAAGMRCENGVCRFIFARNPFNKLPSTDPKKKDTYTIDEALALLRDMGSSSGGALPNVPIPRVGSSGIPVTANPCPPRQHTNRIGLCEPDSLGYPALARPGQLTLTGDPQAFVPRRLGELHTSIIDSFSHNSDTLPSSSDMVLQPLVSVINALPPGVQVYITGYTSTEGSEQKNAQLSTNRASAVMTRLIRLGVTAQQRLVVSGRGPADPVVPNERTDSDRLHNRRVEISYSTNSDFVLQTRFR